MFPTVPHGIPDVQRNLRLLAESINGVLVGRTNNTGEITISRGATTTTLTDPRLSVFSVVVFSPMTANAAANIPYALEANRSNGEWTLTHTAIEQDNQTFSYAIIGGADPYRYNIGRHTGIFSSAFGEEFY
jgi:hypothetical protein